MYRYSMISREMLSISGQPYDRYLAWLKTPITKVFNKLIRRFWGARSTTRATGTSHKAF